MNNGGFDANLVLFCPLPLQHHPAQTAAVDAFVAFNPAGFGVNLDEYAAANIGDLPNQWGQTRLIALLEKMNKGKDELLIYSHEVPDGHGGLILMSDRRKSGEPIEVGRVPASRMNHHRRTVIRIERSYGAGAE